MNNQFRYVKISLAIILVGMSIGIASSITTQITDNSNFSSNWGSEASKDIATPLDSIRNTPKFDKFLKYFLQTCYYKNNIDSLIYSQDKSITNFIHPVVGFGRYTNPGVFCTYIKESGFGYMPREDNYWGKNKISSLKFYNKMPIKGFCEDSPSKKGVYYAKIKELPEYWEHEKEKMVKVESYDKYIPQSLMKVVVLVDKRIVKQMYFAKIGNKWYLVSFDDCDCSA
jgi:hypothetical protein